MREVQVFCAWKDDLESKTMSLGFQSASILSESGGKVALKSKGIYKNQKTTRLNRTGGEDSSESDDEPVKKDLKKVEESSDDDVALFKNHNKPAGVSVLYENPERPKYVSQDKEDVDSDDSAHAALF